MTSQPTLNVVLYQPEIPQNTGNIGRTCVAVGAKLWIVRPIAFRLDDHHLKRSGLDYWPYLNWEVVESWDSFSPQLPIDRTFYLTKSGQRCYTQVRFERGDYLVFGRETSGLPPTLWADRRENSLRIPIQPEVRSLNLANSVAIVAYECLRQFAEQL